MLSISRIKIYLYPDNHYIKSQTKSLFLPWIKFTHPFYTNLGSIITKYLSTLHHAISHFKKRNNTYILCLAFYPVFNLPIYSVPISEFWSHFLLPNDLLRSSIKKSPTRCIRNHHEKLCYEMSSRFKFFYIAWAI